MNKQLVTCGIINKKGAREAPLLSFIKEMKFLCFVCGKDTNRQNHTIQYRKLQAPLD
jgi:hypothetical protein